LPEAFASSRVNFFARYSASPSWAEFGYSQVNRSHFHESSLTAGVTASLSPSLTNDLRVNGSLASVASSWAGNSGGGAAPLNLSGVVPGVVAFESFSINGVGSLNTGDAGRNSQNEVSAVESLALARGNHHFRFGAAAGDDVTVVVDLKTMTVVKRIPVGAVPKRNASGMLKTE
jgi:hypothetical protein